VLQTETTVLYNIGSSKRDTVNKNTKIKNKKNIIIIMIVNKSNNNYNNE